VNGKDEPLSTRTVLLPEILSLKDSLSGRLWVLLAVWSPERLERAALKKYFGAKK